MAQSWLTLPDSWEIENVQAVLAFIISIICAFGIWAVSHVLWKSAATGISRGHKTKLLSLLTLGALGDVVDTIPLLRSDLGTGLLAKLIFQCIVVTILSITAIVSGPIARISTSTGTETREVPVTGWMATSNFHSMNSAQVKWNNTIDRLNSAGFPLDQLLDFLPDVRVDWRYRPAHWNSTWTASCQFTDRTQIALNSTGNYTEPILDEIPAMASVFPPRVLTPGHTITSSMAGAWEEESLPNGDDGWKEVLYFVFIQSSPKVAYQDEPDPAETGRQLNYLPFNITFAVFHLHNAPSVVTDTQGFDIGIGPIEKSWYTIADCQLSRVPSRMPQYLDEDTDWHVSFPWSADPLALPKAFSEFYRVETMDAAFTGGEVHHPTGQEVFRFYQAYLISKDTEFHETVTRPVDVAVATVQLSIVALVVFLFYAFLLCVALAWSVLWRIPDGASIPKTKVEWMMQRVTVAGGKEQQRAGLRAAIHGDVSGPALRSYHWTGTGSVRVGSDKYTKSLTVDDIVQIDDEKRG
ncbi:hypothetical protein B0H66DRAFT_628872 [Apodospora peruviana]|uniref:Uncharacterized protein n=1 Tax=Apodospora peruviana TaxID=516989 RepID=A0AAE0HZE3_9PEZI|nr:hypothetical protein B0H66DRAFT_628872 [Apodospora peruviana]